MNLLKPCPFCGGAKICTEKSINLNYCDNCSAESNIEQWNTRPIEDALSKRIAELEDKDDIETEQKMTDGLLKEATEAIGAVIACCTYNSNEDAKIGIYGIDQIAFTKIDQFITHYNDAVSAGKVSVDVKPVKRDLSDAEIEELGAQEAGRKEFCPNCEAETPCTHEAELFVCDICGEDFAKYIVSRNCNVSDVSMTQDILTTIKTSFDIEDMRQFADRHRGKHVTSGPHWSLVLRFPVLFDEFEKTLARAEKAERELAELKAARLLRRLEKLWRHRCL